jgi:hypothetical protein
MGATGVMARRVVYIATVVCAIAAVIGVLVAVIGVAITWYYGQSRVEVTQVTRPPATSPPVATPVISPAPTPTGRHSPPRDGETGDPPRRPHLDRPALPLEFTLRDGEQQTFLGDQASVAAEFNQVGSEDFVTLRVGTTEGESVPHAVLGAGARFPVRVAGRDYSVYVLSVDKTARTVGVRISRNSESQEKRGQ